METSETLMLGGIAALCPDCGDERILVEVPQSGSGTEFCCTTCDAAVLVLDVQRGAPPMEERRAAI
ncbi:MAG TPA: hypothetical protein VLI04_07545 [Nocardioidaceae bacterium]|nr:hypothetical protein [Nocardioidaceae bacterium]